MESLIFLCLSVFIIYSLVQISILLQQFLVRDSSKVNSYVIVALAGKIPDMEFVARKYMLKYRLDSKMQIVFIDIGLDSESRTICEKFCKTHSGVVFCSDGSIYKNLKRRLSN